MAPTREQCLEQAQLIVGLLEKLGYLINREKSVLEPTQRLEYLGFLIDTVEMKFFLPEMKILKIQNLAEKFLSEQISARQLASLLGLLQATLPAITVASLYFRNLQRGLSKALNSSEGKQSYWTVVVLSVESRGELMWCKNWIPFHRGRNILGPKEQETIFSDASKKGWGAHLGPLEIGGRWCLEERIQHINVQEIQAAFLAIKALLPKIDKPHVQFAIDNQTAETYINKLGRTHSHQLSLLAIELWHFALKMNLTLSVVYVPGIKNCIADGKSRVFKDSLEWMLNHRVFQQILLKMHGIEVDLFASRINHQLTAFVSWRPEPGAMACNAFNLNWGLMKVTFSHLLPDSSLHKKDSARSGRMHFDHISLEEQAMVSSDSISSGRQTVAVTQGQQTAAIARNRQGASSVQPKEFMLGCMASFRKEVSKQKFSEEVSKILQASWRQKTTCQYESAWKAWSSWCDQRQVDPFSTSLNVILEFLAELLHKGYKYRTTGVYRSTISNFHQHIDGIVIGKHPLMSKFMKGVYSMCPPEAKYFVTWDVNQVLSFLKTWAPAEKLTLKQLMLKLVTLAALTSAARSSSVHKMDLHFRQFKSNGVLFKIPELTKCSGPKRPLKELFLASFPPDRRLCFVKYLKRYEKVTKRFRNNSNYNSNRLFLSYIKPQGPVSSSTIARWVKSVLTLSGINTEFFSAHSTRAAASSAAATAGVALKDIMNAADWTNESTFKKFYHKPVFSASFGGGILGLQASPAQDDDDDQ